MSITANRLRPSSSTENIVLVSLELLLFKTLLWCWCSAHRLQSKRPSKPGVGPMPPLAPDSGAVRMSASQYYRSKARYLPGIGKSPHQTVDPSKQQLTDAGTPMFLFASIPWSFSFINSTVRTEYNTFTAVLYYINLHTVWLLWNRDSATVWRVVFGQGVGRLWRRRGRRTRVHADPLMARSSTSCSERGRQLRASHARLLDAHRSRWTRLRPRSPASRSARATRPRFSELPTRPPCTREHVCIKRNLMTLLTV